MRRNLLGVLFLIAVVLAGPAYGQTEEVSSAGLRFNFSPPGARSLAMGGAFVALADDATAAFANPAGLTKLFDKEVSAEGRFWSVFHEFPDRGRLNGTPTGVGVDTYQDFVGPSVTKNDPVRASDFARTSTQALGYAAVVLPLDSVVISAYYHQPLRMEYQFQGQGGFFNQVGNSSDPGRTYPYGVAGNYDIRAAGLGIAFRLSDSISIGASAAMNFFNAQVSTVYFARPADLNPPLFPDRFDPRDPVPPGDTEATVRIDDSASSIAFNAGFTWMLSDQIAFGAVYHHGASFDYAATYNAARRIDGVKQLIPVSSVDAKFNVPHVYVAGLSWLPSPEWRISVDYQHLQFSRLSQDFTSVYATDLGLGRPLADDVDEIDLFDPSTFNPDHFEALDGGEIHVGIEYGFFNLSQPFFVRAGFYTEADPRIRYVGPAELPGKTVYREFYWNRNFDLGTRYHATAGVGLPFSNFQMDFALDYSERATVGSISGVYRF